MKNSMILEMAFSLVEIMVGIAIIAILAAVAVPSYKNYVIRSKVVRAIEETVIPWQKYAESNYIREGSISYPTGSSHLAPGVSLIKTSGGNIELWFNSEISSDLNGKIIQWHNNVSNDIITWSCQSHGASGRRVPCEFLPQDCQTNCI